MVVSIIGILATLALSSLGGLSAKSKQAECQNNLRQIGLGAMAYTADTGGLVYGQFDSSNTWHTVLAPYIQSMDNGLKLADYIGQRPPGVYACPASEYVCRGGNYSDYGINYLASKRHGKLNTDSPVPARRPGSITDPARVMWFADVVNCLREANVWSENGNLDPRHLDNSVNVLFVDGHVENLPLEEIMADAAWNRPPWGWQDLNWKDW